VSISSDGNVQKYDRNNAYDLISLVTENTGEYNRTKIDGILNETGGYRNGVFDSSKFYQEDAQEKAALKPKEAAFQKLVLEKKKKAVDVFERMETSGYGERISTFFGKKNENKALGEQLQNEILNDQMARLQS
jgi:polyphosphate kinase 2 (PPK2 family)